MSHFSERFFVLIHYLKNGGRLFSKILLCSVISGCASNSAKFDRSPCAGCDFEPVNVVPKFNQVHAFDKSTLSPIVKSCPRLL